MYLSPTDLQQSRLAALDHLHAASRIWVDAAERLYDLALRAGRNALDEGRWQLEELADTRTFSFDTLPFAQLDDWRGESAGLVSDGFEIIGDTQQALLALAKTQLAFFDRLLMRQLDRAALSADAHGEAAIDQMKSALRQAESGLHELADAAARGTDLVEEQVRHVSEAFGAGVPQLQPSDSIEVPPPAPRTRSRRATSN